ncbi:hypothetical protein GWK47_023981 [Chionoecetes opilio]|uniref:Uncharacterized protein n=1 Tax=Chionoecetes opilio TaxID=41210 RepID=A0A8J4XLE2_CHIOP|nr:hypothetical protein GWK47_023981 [Chionoecetes opilio]
MSYLVCDPNKLRRAKGRMPWHRQGPWTGEAPGYQNSWIGLRWEEGQDQDEGPRQLWKLPPRLIREEQGHWTEEPSGRPLAFVPETPVPPEKPAFKVARSLDCGDNDSPDSLIVLKGTNWGQHGVEGGIHALWRSFGDASSLEYWCCTNELPLPATLSPARRATLDMASGSSVQSAVQRNECNGSPPHVVYFGDQKAWTDWQKLNTRETLVKTAAGYFKLYTHQGSPQKRGRPPKHILTQLREKMRVGPPKKRISPPVATLITGSLARCTSRDSPVHCPGIRPQEILVKPYGGSGVSPTSEPRKSRKAVTEAAHSGGAAGQRGGQPGSGPPPGDHPLFGSKKDMMDTF